MSSVPGLWKEMGGLALAVWLLGSIAYGFIREQRRLIHAETALIVDVKTTTSTQTDICGPPTKDGRPVVISMLYGDDKRAWVEQAANRFAKLCPTIQVKLSVMGDIESADAILDGSARPMLWAPADELVLRYLDVRWKTVHSQGKLLFDIEKQVSLVQSPLVLLIWDDRRQVVDAVMAKRTREHGQWAELMCAAVPMQQGLSGMPIEDMVPGSWIDWYGPLLPAPKKQPPPAPKAETTPDVTTTSASPFPTVDQIKSWGRAKFGHTSPTRAASGLEVLYLMAYDYVLPPKVRSGDTNIAKKNARSTAGASRPVSNEVSAEGFLQAWREQRSAFGGWLKRCEGGLDAPPASTKLLTDSFFHVGSSRYDAVVTYEHLTFDVLARIDEFASVVPDARILYPQPTIMTQHPVVFLDFGDEITEAQRLVAGKWLAFLRSDEMQKKAIEHGFRPADPALSIRDYHSAQNPFLRFRRYGVTFEDPIIEPPRLDGEVVHELIRTWEDATGRN
ncbi:substrate-binding domain-containing protein [Polyangium sp. y55x31]|uniref:substrate-binding domain-containing protein n=1 Tax=Polyangium sp. y55x31 TaxID=3042688 RepID=UPI00248216A1|nr:substrate-binding domain-containing protein [Polyangium sp. y55x31]MDI1475037.1 substrate-binding domain-containing protein [Polyangium sp. y55x31]